MHDVGLIDYMMRSYLDIHDVGLTFHMMKILLMYVVEYGCHVYACTKWYACSPLVGFLCMWFLDFTCTLHKQA